MGSGQTAIAAIKTIRDYVGYENDNKYFRLAVKRIKKVIQEHKLLNPSI
jgi:site-specific DNA-methyltransferase (adenine-specific)